MVEHKQVNKITANLGQFSVLFSWALWGTGWLSQVLPVKYGLKRPAKLTQTLSLPFGRRLPLNTKLSIMVCARLSCSEQRLTLSQFEICVQLGFLVRFYSVTATDSTWGLLVGRLLTREI